MTIRPINDFTTVTDRSSAQGRKSKRLGRTPPKASNSFRLAFIYRIERSTGFASTTYYLEGMSRKPKKIKSQGGFFVRYDSGWWRLYPPAELQRLLHEARQDSDTILVDNEVYDPALHPFRAFFVCWDNPIEETGADA